MSMGHKILLRFVSITLMSLLLSGGLAVGQEDVTERVENLNAEVMELYQAGKYTEALVPARRVLELSEEALGPDHPDVAFALNVLGLLYHDLGDYAQAEPLYRRALAIDEKTLSPEHPVVAVSLNNLGLLYDATGDYAQAEPLYRRALAIWEQALGSEHPKVALALNNLSGLVAGQKNIPPPWG